jgi:hypothetical protein
MLLDSLAVDGRITRQITESVLLMRSCLKVRPERHGGISEKGICSQFPFVERVMSHGPKTDPRPKTRRVDSTERGERTNVCLDDSLQDRKELAPAGRALHDNSALVEKIIAVRSYQEISSDQASFRSRAVTRYRARGTRSMLRSFECGRMPARTSRDIWRSSA